MQQSGFVLRHAAAVGIRNEKLSHAVIELARSQM